MSYPSFRSVRWLAVLFLLLAAPPASAQNGPICPIDENGRVAEVFYETRAIYWQPVVEHVLLRLSVLTPCGTIEKVFERGETAFFDLEEVAGDLDGQYTWELRVDPVVDPGVRKALDAARAEGDLSVPLELQQKGLLPSGPLVDSGAFSVDGGRIVDPFGKEEQGAKSTAAGNRLAPSRAGDSTVAFASDGLSAEGAPLSRATAFDQVIPDDLIVQGSACVGFDCVNNETFDFDTIRMKENNTRIKFMDTSTTTGFPNVDWQLRANESASGGASAFFIDEMGTGNTTGQAPESSPFAIEANAPTNALRVDSTGRIGLRTASPVLDLHIVTTNTPGIRLEQTSAGGFTAQTWDIAGNEANFFVRDVTGGSRLPLRIRPGAPTSSIDISADGDVGIGTASPSQRLHITDTADSDGAKIFFQGTSASVGHTFGVRSDTQNADLQAEALRNFTVIIDDDNNDTAVSNFLVSINGDPNSVIFQAREDDRIRMNGASATATSHPLVVGTDATDGNGAFLTAAGVWSNGSSRAHKTDIRRLEVADAFDALARLEPVRYRGLEQSEEEYVGFIAEDVPELVAMNDRKGIASMDVVAVLTRVVQELARENDELRRAIQELREQSR